MDRRRSTIGASVAVGVGIVARAMAGRRLLRARRLGGCAVARGTGTAHRPLACVDHAVIVRIHARKARRVGGGKLVVSLGVV